MKKLSIISGIALVLALLAGPVCAQQAPTLWIDIDGDGQADDCIGAEMMVNDTMTIDVYVDASTMTTNVSSVGYKFHWSASCNVVSAPVPYLKTGPTLFGPWDTAGQNQLNSTYDCSLFENLAGVPVPDPAIPLHQFVVTCTGVGTCAIVIDSIVVLDFNTFEFFPSDVTCDIDQKEPQCTCDLDPATVELGPDDTQQFTATPHAINCDDQNPTYVWSDDCGCGSVDQNGLFTADTLTVFEECTVSAVDSTNTTTDPPIICTADVTCVPATQCASKIYRGGVCEESSPLDTIYNRPGRRGLSITCCEEEEFCICSSCEGESARDHCWFVTKVSGDPDFDPAVNLVADSGTGDQFTLKVADPCTTHCPDEVVILEVTIEDCAVPGFPLDSVEVQIGRVAIGMGDTNAHPDTQTTDVDILLWNYENHVRAIQADICGVEMEDCNAYGSSDACDDTLCGQIGDETDCGNNADCQWKIVGGVSQCVNMLNCAWVAGIDPSCVAQDNVVCTECVVDENRSTEFICSANEQPNGCCRVTLYTTEPDDLIQQGDGAVARVKYDVGDFKTSKDCIELIPTEIKISDQFNEFLCAVPKAGEICFRICGDVYPQDCYECESCGDGIVDLFDILEEIDIVLGLQIASNCQMLHGDVPLGMPPYCGNPAGVTPPNCESDGVIDIFDALVIIDKALSRMNCCDYCMFGSIY